MWTQSCGVFLASVVLVSSSEISLLQYQASAQHASAQETLVPDCYHVVSPSFMYIGLPHVGSSSLAYQLALHPNISNGDMKEHRYFAANIIWEDVHYPPNRTFQDYLNEFNVPCDKSVTFDATPTMLYLGLEDARDNCSGETNDNYNFPWEEPGVPALEKIKSYLGENLKFIAMFRDPMDIAKGHWLDGQVNQRCHACDADSVEAWLSVWPKENFLFINADEYFEDPATTVRDVYDFLGVEPHELHEDDFEAKGRRRNTGDMDTPFEGRRRVTKEEEEQYEQDRVDFWADATHQECKQRLERLTGLNLVWEHAP